MLVKWAKVGWQAVYRTFKRSFRMVRIVFLWTDLCCRIAYHYCLVLSIVPLDIFVYQFFSVFIADSTMYLDLGFKPLQGRGVPFSRWHYGKLLQGLPSFYIIGYYLGSVAPVTTYKLTTTSLAFIVGPLRPLWTSLDKPQKFHPSFCPPRLNISSRILGGQPASAKT